MPAPRVIPVHAPLAGVVRSTDFQNQSPYSAFDSLDFWPVDAKTGRDGLAIRPGFTSYNAQSNANLIFSINVAPSETSQRVLVTAAGGTLYTWPGGSPTSVGSGVDTGRNVQAAVYLNRLFIANNTPKTLTYGGSLTNWTATTDLGTVPANARLICEWDNRIVMAGVTTAPHIWFMSRIGDPDDWLYVPEDDSSPVSSTDLDGGQLSGPITSLIPHNRTCILFGTANSLTVLRENPVDGGNLETLDHVVGPVDGTAWCKTADDWTYFLTRDGLYKMPPGCGTNPQSVSREKIPDSLIGLDGISNKVYLGYDVRFRCVHIYVEGPNAQDWHYFPTRDAFVPVTSPGTSIMAIGRFEAADGVDVSGLLVGTAGGLKRLDRTAPLGGTSKAYAKIGPYRLASTLSEKGLIQRAAAKFRSNTDDVNAMVDFYAGSSAEAVTALPADKKASAPISSFDDGHVIHPRVGDQAGMMVITQSDTSKHICFEEAALYVLPRGKVRS